MTESEIQKLVSDQRAYFRTGTTLSLSFRRERLELLARLLRTREGEYAGALRTDLGKSPSESYLCEIGMARSEVSYLLRNLAKLSCPRRARTPLAQFPARSFLQPMPLGNTLILSPWNYPLLLTVGPLAAAIAAGDTVILKPSAYSPHTSALLARLIGENFDPRHIGVVTGGREENAALLDQKFDFVFFTGSQNVGREVLRRCAEHLTPAVLELGGKSPCIVDRDADIPLAARRIVFGKFLNCGQTCVAPDYVLCQKDVESDFLREVQKQIRIQFGEEPLKNPDYGNIISRKHFDRLLGLLDPAKTLCGGETEPERLRIAPTVLTGVTAEDPVMGQEIFGPILPVLTCDRFADVTAALKQAKEPLALYLFSGDRDHIRTVTREIPSGGVCLNDVIVHLATEYLPFGGVGQSGMGAYHGKTGFDTFSHLKPVLDRKLWPDLPMRYQPYTKKKDKAVRQFLK